MSDMNDFTRHSIGVALIIAHNRALEMAAAIGDECKSVSDWWGLKNKILAQRKPEPRWHWDIIAMTDGDLADRPGEW